MTALAPLNWRTLEEGERQHGVGAPPFDEEEGRRGERGEDEGGHDEGIAPAPRRALDETVGESGQEDDGQPGAGHVDVVGRGRVARLGDVARREDEHGCGHGDVDEEDPAPRGDGQQVAPDQRAGGRGHAGKTRPGADGSGAVVVAERGLDDGQTARGQQRAADALDDAGDHQEPGVGGEATGGRGDGEPGDADGEDAPSPEAVAERAAEEEEGGQGQRVARHDPLQGARRRRRTSG